FDFVPDEPGDVDRYRFPDWSDKGQYLTVGAGMNPPRAWVEDQGIVEGSTQRCMRLEITKGTCTPVIFSFPEIDFSGWADAPSGQITPEIPASTLLNREWVLESYGEPGNLQTVSEDAEITIEFKSDEPRFGGSAGCNRYFGGYEMEDDELSTTGPIGSTEMWCEGKMEQEDQYLQALQKVSMFIIEENRLQLFYDEKSVLIFTLKEAETAKGLTDREWVLESIGEGQTMQSLLKDTEITIEFTSDEARFGGSAGCNRYFGGYAVEGNNLSVPGPVGSTMMACPEPIMDQEQQYLSTLEGAETFEIEDGTLTIFSSANRLLVFSER
ncbi:MAG: META domain-containing protein, partial [Chloroflexota bacterium]|nr:META domain-containing protein [Chloroflexota bacterium]